MTNQGFELDPIDERRVATIYVDESGNKFDEGMFHESPFFVYAWLLLTTEQEDKIKSRISELLRKEGFPEHGELRAKNMWASGRGLRRFTQVMEILRDSGGRAW